jgi:hypothetical protein
MRAGPVASPGVLVPTGLLCLVITMSAQDVSAGSNAKAAAKTKIADDIPTSSSLMCLAELVCSAR